MQTSALKSFYRGKRVLVTGHTGFKGSWLALWLQQLGATVQGISLPPVSPLTNFTACRLADKIDSTFLDVRDTSALAARIESFSPDVVFHLAAQAIVGTSFSDPLLTFETNVLGTINVLEAARRSPRKMSLVLITSDKCYENVEQIWGYREIDRLGGDDPYSSSKACAELAIAAYRRSFFTGEDKSLVASTRAGNVIGGGDWSAMRLVPDCFRALRARETVVIRSPHSTRPWQFVLDPLAGYLQVGMRQALEGQRFARAWNFGPPIDTSNTVLKTAQQIVTAWGEGIIDVQAPNTPFQEHHLLQLDCTQAMHDLQWRPLVDFERTMRFTTVWYRRQHDIGDGDMFDFSCQQIREYEALLETGHTS